MKGLKLQVILITVCLISLAFSGTLSAQPREFKRIPLGPNEIGPETLTFDCNGEGPYAGINDGRIIKWQGEQSGWIDFAVTSPIRSSNVCDGPQNPCGRPLGLKFNKAKCELYIADSVFGLMKVGREGGVATLLTNTAEDVPILFGDGLDVDSDSEIVYFTDASSHYRLWENLKILETGDRSGRFMKYDPQSGNVTVLLRDLAFANGVALSKKKDFVLVAETIASRILRYWLTGPKAGTSEVFIDQLAGSPDNINRNVNGDFWVAVRDAKSIKVDESGQILEYLDDQIVIPTDVSEVHDEIWIGYLEQPYIDHSS